MKAGYASFHHPVLMHGSFENRSLAQRRATVINVFGDGVVSNLDFVSEIAPGTKNYPSIPVGHKMEGTYYPLLFNPEETSQDLWSNIPTVGNLKNNLNVDLTLKSNDIYEEILNEEIKNEMQMIL